VFNTAQNILFRFQFTGIYSESTVAMFASNNAFLQYGAYNLAAYSAGLIWPQLNLYQLHPIIGFCPALVDNFSPG
jgi:hypothetical protein